MPKNDYSKVHAQVEIITIADYPGGYALVQALMAYLSPKQINEDETSDVVISLSVGEMKAWDHVAEGFTLDADVRRIIRFRDKVVKTIPDSITEIRVR